MEAIETIYLPGREEWRAWLEENHDKKQKVWLVYYKKGSGKPRIPYDDAVEEAICFGWIDSTVNSIDGEKYKQLFSQRKKGSKWSLTNIRRAEEMIRQGKMAEAGLLEFQEKCEYDITEQRETYSRIDPEIPVDLLAALEENEAALKNFKAFSPSYRRLSIRWICRAKREETRRKRIEEVATLSAENKKIGMK